MTETFVIVPANVKPLWLLLPACLILVAALALLGSTWYGSRRASFELSPAGLRLRGDLYGRLIPAARLAARDARVVDLRVASELRPVRRTLGTALPGYAAGWFRLQNGEKALLYLTDRSRAVYVPTLDGYALLLSPTRPEELVRALHALAAASHAP